MGESVIGNMCFAPVDLRPDIADWGQLVLIDPSCGNRSEGEGAKGAHDCRHDPDEEERRQEAHPQWRRGTDRDLATGFAPTCSALETQLVGNAGDHLADRHP